MPITDSFSNLYNITKSWIMILSSKQALIISANENKEFFMFDPKTTAVLHKYRTQEAIEPHHVYY